MNKGSLRSAFARNGAEERLEWQSLCEYSIPRFAL